MEWLSHTQKKHCELCKTSFRFTKLYHPGMPNRIPTAVFIRRAALHVLNMFVTWCRGILVASVWLLLVPWCMRMVWRSLFWVGDGAWSAEMLADTANMSDASPLLNPPLAANPSTSSTVANLTSSAESTFWGFASRFLLGVPYPFAQIAQIYQLGQLPLMDVNGTASNSTSNLVALRSPSLLSDVPFLNWFESQTLNRLMIDVLEGQMITLFVVVAFILIFLIREWVVQQQPVINMVALGNDAAVQRPADQVNQGQEAAVVEQNPADNIQDIQPADDDAPEEPRVANNGQEGREGRAPTIRRIRRSSSLRRRKDEVMRELDTDGIHQDIRDILRTGSAKDLTRALGNLGIEDGPDLQDLITAALNEHQPNGHQPAHGYDDEPDAEEPGAGRASSSSSNALPIRRSSLPQQPMSAWNATGGESSQSNHRPNMPARDRSFIATNIRRGLEEGNAWSFGNLQRAAADNHEPNHVPDSWDDEDAEDPRSARGRSVISDEAVDSEHSSDSWQQVPDVVADDSDQALEGVRPHDKGKAKLDDASSTKGINGTGSTDEDSSSRVDSQAETTLEDDRSDLSEAGSDLPSELLQLTPDQQHLDEQPVAADPPPPADLAQPPANALDLVLDWMFGDVAPATAAEDAGNDERVVRNLADEAPFVPFVGNEPREHGNVPIQDPEVAAAAAQAGLDVNDQEAIEDAEDLEGILELIGMQGPIIGLFQNALFSAVLISATLSCAVWLPYLWGKVVLLFMGSPISLLIKLPLQLVATLTDLIVDITLFLVAGITYGVSVTISSAFKIVTQDDLRQTMEGPLSTISAPTHSLAANALGRIVKLLVESPLAPRPDYFMLSINSHAALRSIQNTTSFALNETSNLANAVFEEIAADSPLQFVLRIFRAVPVVFQAGSTMLYAQITALLLWISAPKSYKITLDFDLGQNTPAEYTTMERWTASDRMIAIFAGYGFFALAGAVYLKRGTPFSTSQQGQKIERVISDILQQAGGVLKVILIISIEMLAFPLYCGLLLDLAMLPLFKNATLYTRWQFARESPWTSGFVHWFIGTCYMFHFALFVSMCRKIMRKGVLYFIRDPDDPTFHPVRDVLERSVTTQLRKIAFSALVYGALVVICLGGVVWTLSRVTSDVLPIHWTTEAPSLEFPLDLLFYNFLTPVIIKFYKPSEGLHTLYTWWFKTCAGYLRLSSFLFGDKDAAQELADGKYVRAPSSDQARIPKGQAVFVEVDWPENVRKDGITEGGVHNNPDLVTVVYIPSWFRVRVFCFVVTIWAFMGISGVSVTILPLLFGRFLFSLFLPPTVEMNDIHAFSLGIYTLGSLMYSLYHAYKFVRSLQQPMPDAVSTFRTITATTSRVGGRVLRFSYVWASLIFAIPFLFAVLIELYFLMPLHAYLGPKEPHVVHLIQDWTLGFLYARLAARLVFANRNSRPARAFTAVVRNGYLHPNARIATRCFLLPVLAIFLVAIAIPASLSFITNRTLYYGASQATKKLVWRYSFPAVGLSIVVIWASNVLVRLLVRWRLVVRDEVYLIGERLHNFGEKRAPVPVSAPARSEGVAGESVTAIA